MWIEYYFAPELAAPVQQDHSSAELFLSCCENSSITPDTKIRLCCSADGVIWSDFARLPVSPGPIVVKDKEILIFHGEDFAIVDIDSIRKKESFENIWKNSGRYDFSWRPIIALSTEEKVFLYGYEKDDETNKLREAVVYGLSANQTHFFYPIRSLAEISGCILEDRVYLFFREKDALKPQCIVISQDGRHTIKEFGKLCAFSAVSDGKRVYLFGSPREEEHRPTNHLAYYILDGKSVLGPFGWEYNLCSMWGSKHPVVETSATTFRGEIYLSVRTGDKIAVSKFTTGLPGNFVTVIEAPLSGRIASWCWTGGIVATVGALVIYGFLFLLLRRRQVTGKNSAERHVTESASLLRRAVAFGIDFTILTVLFVVTSAPTTHEHGYSVLEILGLEHPFILKIFALLYLALPEFLFGQTIGKSLVGVAVKTEYGGKVSLWNAVVRNIFKLVYFIVLIEMVVVIHTRRGQRIGDIVAGTMVVPKQNKNRK